MSTQVWKLGKGAAELNGTVFTMQTTAERHMRRLPAPITTISSSRIEESGSPGIQLAARLPAPKPRLLLPKLRPPPPLGNPWLAPTWSGGNRNTHSPLRVLRARTGSARVITLVFQCKIRRAPGNPLAIWVRTYIRITTGAVLPRVVSSPGAVHSLNHASEYMPQGGCATPGTLSPVEGRGETHHYDGFNQHIRPSTIHTALFQYDPCALISISEIEMLQALVPEFSINRFDARIPSNWTVRHFFQLNELPSFIADPVHWQYKRNDPSISSAPKFWWADDI
ncbi:hypothetical protein C8R44DRAFT_738906 [Mycena epipterygia]|nr:hypothetical protein C8R44DRAFT_738906 [Mycena epipterygia]